MFMLKWVSQGGKVLVSEPLEASWAKEFKRARRGGSIWSRRLGQEVRLLRLKFEFIKFI